MVAWAPAGTGPLGLLGPARVPGSPRSLARALALGASRPLARARATGTAAALGAAAFCRAHARPARALGTGGTGRGVLAGG